jgi:hypothetical protein
MKPKLTASIATTAAVAIAAGSAGAAGGAGTFGPPKLKASNYVRHVTNPYFPLKPGTTWVYTGVKDGEAVRNVVQATHRTKKIRGVTATVVRDRLFGKGNRIVETTIDWYAQDKRGDVVYMGEATRALDKHGKLTDTEGSWQAGVHGAKPGIFMPAHPKVGQTFRQELLKGHAEDHFRILSTKASVTVPALSSKHALRTRETTPLERGVVDAKFYVRGVGTVKEATVKGGDEHLELVSVKH